MGDQILPPFLIMERAIKLSLIFIKGNKNEEEANRDDIMEAEAKTLANSWWEFLRNQKTKVRSHAQKANKLRRNKWFISFEIHKKKRKKNGPQILMAGSCYNIIVGTWWKRIHKRRHLTWLIKRLKKVIWTCQVNFFWIFLRIDNGRIQSPLPKEILFVLRTIEVDDSEVRILEKKRIYKTLSSFIASD